MKEKDRHPTPPLAVVSEGGALRIPLTGEYWGMTMSNYVIMRMTKIKNTGVLVNSLRHAFRDKETLNADPDRMKDNEIFHGGNSTNRVLADYKKRLPKKEDIQVGAVHAIEYMMTASPEQMRKGGKLGSKEKQDAYFERCVGWLKKKYGEENVIHAAVHRDESNPHMYAYVVPLVERTYKSGRKINKLSAKHHIGNMSQMSKDQTLFWEFTGKSVGLDRGDVWSKSKHTPMKALYYDANDALGERPEMEPITPKKEDMGPFGLSKEEAAKKASELTYDALKPYIEKLEDVAERRALTERDNLFLIRDVARKEEEQEKLKKKARKTKRLISTFAKRLFENGSQEWVGEMRKYIEKNAQDFFTLADVKQVDKITEFKGIAEKFKTLRRGNKNEVELAD